MLASKSSQIDQLERQNADSQQKEAELQRQLADKSQQLLQLQRDLYNEQEKDQKRFIDSVERLARLERALTGLAVQSVSMHATEGDSRPSYDAFISHASEDKEDLVRPLADALQRQGLRVWYDEFELKVGDSLRRSIDRGLASSRFGIVVLSPDFFAKNWPQYELDGLVAKEIAGGKVILPLWHKVSKDEVLAQSPSLSDKVALHTATLTVEELAAKLREAMSVA